MSTMPQVNDDVDENEIAARAILNGQTYLRDNIHITQDHKIWFQNNGMDGLRKFYPQLVPAMNRLLKSAHDGRSGKRKMQ